MRISQKSKPVQIGLLLHVLPGLLTNHNATANIFQVNYKIRCVIFPHRKGSVLMNHFKKMYCRIFQTGLKIALPFLPYRKPKIVGSVKALPEVIQKKKCSKVLIITDAGIRKLGLTRRLEKALENAGIPYCIYDKTVANPTTANVSEAMDLYRNNGCDCIIGFGGGSSMVWTVPRPSVPALLNQSSLWQK